MKPNPSASISQFVTFTANDELFGVVIHAVEEIITLPEKVTPVPKAPEYFSGMINLRGEVISVIDLRKRFGFATPKVTTTTRILIVSIDGVKIGMTVDSVTRVMPIKASDVKAPPIVVEQGKARYIFGSVQMTDQVLLLLDTDQLIPKDELILHKHVESADGTDKSGVLQLSERGEERILIGFRLGKDNFALDINYVEEIIEIPEITVVPEMKELIDGIFYQRNQALPLLRLNKRFKMPDQPIDENTSVLIVNEGGLVMGFIVDEITEVFQVFQNEIVEPPANLSGASAEQLEGIIKVKQEKETIVVMALNLAKLLTDSEQEHLVMLKEGLNDESLANQDDSDLSEILAILKFKVKDELFAIRVLEINEITKIQKMIAVPKAPDFVNGVINLRGDIITIIDFSKLFGNEASKMDETSRIIIVEVKSHKAGFLVDEILGIDRVPYNLFEPPSELIKGQYNQFIDGIGREVDKDVVIILIDSEATLSQAENYDGNWGTELLEAPM